MKKIPTLFKRVYDPETHKIINITSEVMNPKCWMAFKLGTPTIKMDGSCCAIIDGKLYKRYDAKKGRKIPPNAIPCQPDPDPVTGHHPHWVLCDPNNPADKWFIEAYMAYSMDNVVIDGTFEAIGKHFNNNPYGLQYDILDPHGSHEINEVFDTRDSRTFENVREYLRTHYIEGIVFWYCGDPVCKIKRTDFGFPWGDDNAVKSWLNELYGAIAKCGDDVDAKYNVLNKYLDVKFEVKMADAETIIIEEPEEDDFDEDDESEVTDNAD